MIRAVVVGHTYIVNANRGKLRHLADLPDVELSLICPETWPEPDFGDRRFQIDDRFNSIALKVKNAGGVRRHFYPIAALARTLSRLKPDIVQWEAEAGSLSSLQAAFTKIAVPFRLVLFVWDNIIAGAWFHLKAARISYRSLDHLIAGSGQALQVARTQGYKGRATILPQIGLDPDAYRSVRKRNPWEGRSGFRVGYIGRLSPKKGVEFLIEAAAELPEVLLTIVGDGAQRSELVQKAASLGLEDRIAFIGGVPHEEVAALIKGMDALVLPSVSTPGWTEQFGHVIIEAMAASVPVIGSRSGVIPEIIGDAGLLFDERDANGLAAGIRALMNDSDAAARLAAKGLERVKQHFTDRVIADKTFEVWQEVLKAR